MSKEPFPCSTISTLKSNLEVKLEEYKVALEEVRVEGTMSSVNRLKEIEVELDTIKGEIEDELSKVGYSLEIPEVTDPNVINQELKELGSPATIDTNIEGGVINLTLSPEILKALQSYDTAIEAYTKIPRTTEEVNDPFVYYELKNLPWNPLTYPNLEVLILNHGETKEIDRDLFVIDMKALGYRPLHFSELVALALAKPDLNRRNEYFNTYEKYILGDAWQAPFFGGSNLRRYLNAILVDVDWGHHIRSLFVRS